MVTLFVSFVMTPRTASATRTDTLFPYTTLFRSPVAKADTIERYAVDVARGPRACLLMNQGEILEGQQLAKIHGIMPGRGVEIQIMSLRPDTIFLPAIEFDIHQVRMQAIIWPGIIIFSTALAAADPHQTGSGFH